jgi:DNA polymerase-3 subunit gamma/tau
MLEVSEAAAAALKQQSALANTESLTRILEVLTDSEIRLRDATSKKILLEVTLLKIIEARNASSLDAVLKQLVQLRGDAPAFSAPAAPAPVTVAAPARPASIAPPAPPPMAATPAPAPKSEPVPAPEPTPILAETAAVAPATGSLEDLWKALIDSVGRASPFTRSYLVEAQPVSFERGLLTIGFDQEFEDYRGLVDNSRNHTLLQTKLTELGHPGSQIKFIKTENSAPRAKKPEPSAAPTPVPVAAPAKPRAAAPKLEKSAPATVFNKDEFKDDPLIKKALEIFKGQIIEVRA